MEFARPVFVLSTPRRFRNDWLVVVDIIGAGKLFQQKEENNDTRIGLKTVRNGKIGVKSLLVEYG